METISAANMIETLSMSLQAGFIDTPEEIDALSSIVSRLLQKFLSDCEQTTHLPIDEIRETIETAEDFINVVVNSHIIDFVDEVESHGVCLSIIDTFTTLGVSLDLLKL